MLFKAQQRFDIPSKSFVYVQVRICANRTFSHVVQVVDTASLFIEKCVPYLGDEITLTRLRFAVCEFYDAKHAEFRGCVRSVVTVNRSIYSE